MANGPIQIVVNSNEFIETWDRSGGGEHKDFYEGNDKEFQVHRDQLVDQLNLIRSKSFSQEYGNISYAKVLLKPSALAKVHRPTTTLFRKEVTPVVGIGNLGELFVELSPAAVDEINSKVQSAELESRYIIKKSNKQVAKPSHVRSEVGAIDEIVPYMAADKRQFSIAESIDWLSHPGVGGMYIIELFELIPPLDEWKDISANKRQLFSSFIDGLKQMELALNFSILHDKGKMNLYGIRLLQGGNKMRFSLTKSNLSEYKELESDFNPAQHSLLMKFLEKHPLVRSINLPPIIAQSSTVSNKSKVREKFKMTIPNGSGTYPLVAIVDGGVSKVFDEWISFRHGLLSKDDREEDHGSFIAGLLVAGNSLNTPGICSESDGCRIVDIDIYPKQSSAEDYYTNFEDFFTELEKAVVEVKAKTGVRVFNFSLNIQEHSSSNEYGYAARWLDFIAETYDVIFVISAGNTNSAFQRKEWPDDPLAALKILASARNDTLKNPAESFRNISVSALNPPNMKGVVPYSPSSYSCRGPKIPVGLKPDLAHVGGCGVSIDPYGFGLFSLNPEGYVIDDSGTSYAAPLVAKAFASIENSIQGNITRETLLALGIHNASLPDILQDKNLKEVAKHLVGFGMPNSSDAILEGNEYSITLVFANRILPGRKMRFGFTWPPSLVNNGKCKGAARLTVVSTPPFDYKYQSEFVRVNIEGSLRQEQDNGNFLGRLEPLYLPEKGASQLFEKSLIEHSFKWSPIKVYEKSFKKGVGPSSNWSLDIEYLARDGVSVPKEGVPFTAILTISDLDKKKPVFTDMRKILQIQGAKISDIRTAATVKTRI